MKVRLIIILIANMFILHFIIPLFKVLKLNELIGLLVKQLQTNISYVEEQLKGSVK